MPVGEDRSLVLDILHFARNMPLHPAERSCDLSRVAALREAASTRISWSVLFLKAYSLLAARQPELRRTFMDWLRPHFYEHPHSVGMLTICRQYQGVERLFVGRFIRPEVQSLVELQRRLDRYQTDKVESCFLRQLRLGRLPTLVRRILWWCNLRVHGPTRAGRVGTFSISTLAGKGALNRWHPSVLTSSLTWGPLDDAGRSLVTMIYDHRVMDGMAAARGLEELVQILNGVIATELESLVPARLLRQVPGSSIGAVRIAG